MVWTKGEVVKGFQINGEWVCPDCIAPEEEGALQMGGSLTSDEEEGWDYFFCSRCEEWVS